MRSPLPSRLRRARLVLLWERLWRALVWPASGLSAALLGLALLSRLPDPAEPLHWALLGALALLPAAGLLLGLQRFRLPTEADALARIDQDLPHAPARTLLDRPATEDPVAQALWMRHQARAAAQLAAAPPPVPRPGLAARDPRALRALVPLGALVVLVVLQADGAALERALWPPAGRPVPPPPAVQAWLEPPSHAEGAAVQPLLQGGQGQIPVGGRLRLSVSGGPAEAFLGGRPLPLTPGEDLLLPLSTPFQALLSVRARGQEAWRAEVEVLRDQAPRAELSQAADRGDGRLRLSVRLSDDLGLQGGLLRLEDARGGVETFVLEGARGRAAEIPVVLDVARDARAGTAVRLVAVAEDGAGQAAEATLDVVLPERQWRQPLARRLADAHRLLLRRGSAAAPGIEAAALDLRAADAPLGAVLAAAAAARRARAPDGVWEAEVLLWEAALEIEEGPIGRALADAARAAQEGADAAQAIEAAIDALIEALARLAQAAPAAASAPGAPGAEGVRAEDLADAAADARRLAADGRIQEARELLARLAETLQRLSEASAQGAAPDPARQAAAQAMAEEARRLLAEQTAAADRLARAAPQPLYGASALSADALVAETRALADRLRDSARQVRQGAEQRRIRRDETLEPEAASAADALERAADAVGGATPRAGRDALATAGDALARLDAALADAAARGRLFPDDGLFRALPPDQRAQLRAQEALHARRIEQQRAQVAAQLEDILARRAQGEAAEAAAEAARAAAGPIAPQAEAQQRIADGAAGLEAGAEALGLAFPGAAASAGQAAAALAAEDAATAATAQAQAADALRRLLDRLEQAGGQGGGGGGTAPGARRPWEGGRPDLTGQGGATRRWQERIQERLREENAPEIGRLYWRRLLRLPETP
jgi:hypothetical protein